MQCQSFYTANQRFHKLFVSSYLLWLWVAMIIVYQYSSQDNDMIELFLKSESREPKSLKSNVGEARNS